MRYLYLIVAFILFSCNACQKPKARKPVSVKSSSTYSKSAERTKKLLEKENELIDNYIKTDSLHTYVQSQHGFNYAYIKRDSTTINTPVFGNRVIFKYNVTDLNNITIYSEDELGIQSYRVDQQNIMNGLRKGLKLMHTNETIKCIFPSQIAYGYKGDRNKIKPNTPIVCTITLNEILTLNDKK